MKYFHDIEFGGVVLRIPCVRTPDAAAQLDNAFKKIHDIIEDEIKPHAKVSHMHPAWHKNRHELLEYGAKISRQREEQEKANRREKRRQRRIDQIKNHDRFDIVIKDMSEATFKDYEIRFPDETIEVQDDDFTKHGLKQGFIDDAGAGHTDDDWLQAICADGCFQNVFEYNFKPDAVALPDPPIYATTYTTIGYRIKRKHLQVYHRENTGRTGGYFYHELPLYYEPERDEEFIVVSNGFDDDHPIYDLDDVEEHTRETRSTPVKRLYLGDFKEVGNQLVRSAFMES